MTTLAVVLGLAMGGLPAQAKDLTDARDTVRQAIVDAKKQIAEGKAEVADATKQLVYSKTRLASAERKLAGIANQLDVARAQDAKVGQRLKLAEAELAVAAAKVKVAQQQVDEQLDVIGVAVRNAYQQQTGLVGYAVALSSETTADVSQRLQWSSTIFDTSAADLDRLRELEDALVVAKRRQAERAAQVQKEKDAAEQHLAAVGSLERAAASARSQVAGLVAAKAKAKAAAEADLEADQQQYRKLQAEDRKIGAEIKRRAAIALKKKLAEEARKRAAAKKAGKKFVPTAESSKGFIYPVNATPGSPFGLRFHPILHYWRMHRGQDFGAPCGAPLFAVADGKVASARWQGGFGNYTVIDIGFINGKFVSVGYAHQSKLAVRAGESVKQGEVIGYVGTTGLSTGCHLHFQVYVNGNVVNPMSYL